VRAADEELMLAFGRGDVRAFELLVRRWEDPLLNFICRSVGDRERAKEIRQETFLRVIKARKRYRPRAKFSTWLYRIAVNLCRSEHRKRKRHGEVYLEDAAEGWAETRLVEETAGPDKQAQSREAAQAVRAAIGRLPEEQKEVVLLRQYHGLGFAEIAEIVGCPVSTAKSRMYYAMNNLRRDLEGLGL